MRHAAVLAIMVAAATGVALAPQKPLERNAKIDAVFAAFDKPGSPGCALGVVQNGALAYARGYGLASVEHNVPITPQTVFDLGSVSKQITAMAVLLLERDGKLALDEDIRKYLPEIPDYGHRITLRHLLTHTSGLRDYGDLMELDGHDVRDHTTDRDAFEILTRQRGVNFAPGDEWRYSNTGFFLASVIVKRAGGESIASFARRRIFDPLQMTNTLYLDDTRRIVPRRAEAYDAEGAGFTVDMSDWDQTGDGAVQTTVEDLARWAENFSNPVVGDRTLVDAMQTVGRLNNGKPHGYGLGLAVDTYRGLRRIQHGGSWAGYRAMLTRFPDQRTAIVVLCNVSNAGTARLAEGVADAWLESAGLGPRDTRPTPAAAPAPYTPSDAQLREYAGRYTTPELTMPWELSVADGTLIVRVRKGDGERLNAVGPDEFRLAATTITFTRDERSHAVSGLVISNRGVGQLRLRRTS